MKGWLAVGCLLLSQSAVALTLFQPNVDAVKNKLNDPYSAKFESVERVANGAVCGTYNSKNQYGAYVGRQEFAIVGGTPYMEGQDDDAIMLYCITGRDCKDEKCIEGKKAQLTNDQRSASMAAVIGDQRMEASATCRAHMPASADKMMECSNQTVVCRNKPSLADEFDCLAGVIHKHRL